MALSCSEAVDRFVYSSGNQESSSGVHQETGEELLIKEEGHSRRQWELCISEQAAAKVLCFPLLVKRQVVKKTLFGCY